MVGPAVALLRRSVACGRDYLWRRCFPETLTIRPRSSRRAAELGGAAIFGAAGFGTPNDLVPAELGPCALEAATDGRVARVLGDARVVARVALEAGWTPAAPRPRQRRAPYSAFVDAGALVTGLSNREAAAALLAGGLGHCDGVLYFDEEDRPRVARRRRRRPRPASRSRWAVHAFYDHAHCTGLDVAQAADCRGALTLSKDSTYRDLAQAAFRLRRLGAGQTLALLVSPELAGCLAEARAAPRAAVAAALGDDAAWPALLRELLAWLAANGLRRERVNFFLLAEQSVANVARKASRGGHRTEAARRRRARARVRPRLARPRATSPRERRRARSAGGAAAAFEGLQEQEAEEEAEEQAQEREQERRVEARPRPNRAPRERAAAARARQRRQAVARRRAARRRGRATSSPSRTCASPATAPRSVAFQRAREPELQRRGARGARRLRNVAVVLEYDAAPAAAAAAAPAAAAARAVAAANARCSGRRDTSRGARTRARRWDYVAAATAVPGEAGLRRARAARASRRGRGRRRGLRRQARAPCSLHGAPATLALRRRGRRARSSAARTSATRPAARRRRRPRRRATPGPSRSCRARRPRPGPATSRSASPRPSTRGLLHAARRRGGPGAPPSLRVVSRWDGTADSAARRRGPAAPARGLVLGAAAGRAAPDGERDATALACLQFFDVADDLSPRTPCCCSALQRAPPAAAPLRDASGRCRRRPRVARFGALGWLAGAAARRRPAPAPPRPAAARAGAPAPVRAALVLDDEARVVEHRAAAAALRLRLDAAGAPAAALLRRAA
ncbi:hypothetical protein JL722_9154 [Aureococcus anophagefferens]|nr:hypothetical protein JL722_9154 [Aureococcus anophagefferens]